MSNDIDLRKKIGQMLIIGFKGTELHSDTPIVKAILQQEIGGVILFDYDYQAKTYGKNIKNPSQLKQLTQQLQSYAKQSGVGSKLFISTDYEGGEVTRLKEKNGFPHTLSAAELGNGSFEQAEKYAKKMAETLQQAGINMNFAPLVDLNINPDNPVIGKINRSFSSNPQKVSDYAAIFSQAYRDHGIFCVYKHFPGHGSSTGDSHEGFVDVTDTWKKIELEPYKMAFKKQNACPIVMTAHVVNSKLDPEGYPASLSKRMTQKLLREELKFKGVIVTDDLQMKAISANYGLRDALILAINAGSDILIFGNQLVPGYQNPEQLIDIIEEEVKKGRISKKLIDESYERIVLLKHQKPL